MTSRLAAPLGTFGAAGAAFAYVGLLDPNEPGHYPMCPLLYLTGVFCPACGGLRTAHAVAHGDLGTALATNALVTAGFAVAAVFWVHWVVSAARGRSVRLHLLPWQVWTVAVAGLVFTVVRNLPFGAVLAP